MNTHLFKNTTLKQLVLLISALFAIISSTQAQSYVTKTILIKNVHVFNGEDNAIAENQYILIAGDSIKAMGKMTDSARYHDNVDEIIDGKGYYAMPGLIDSHTHLLQETIAPAAYAQYDFPLINFIGAEAAKQRLMRGFTTVRNMGGAAISLSRAIDKGLVIGPRIYPSGAFISQTGGHGDVSPYTDVPREHLSYSEQQSLVAIADGADQVLLKSREQLRQGATQLKLMAGGGINSPYDHIDAAQYSEAEFRAAVGAAKNWGTYVGVHAYTDEATF